MATSKKGGWSDAPAQAPLSNPFAALAALRPADAAPAAAAPAADTHSMAFLLKSTLSSDKKHH